MITHRRTHNRRLRRVAGLLAASMVALGLMAPAAQAEDNYQTIGVNNGTYTILTDEGEANSGVVRLLNNNAVGMCLEVGPDGALTDAPCDHVSRWNLQPNRDGGGYLLRHIGDNKCVDGTTLADCGSDAADNYLTDSPMRPNLVLTRAAAINLGKNSITICNWGGYLGRAVIDYKVQEDPNSTAETSDRKATDWIPVRQCRTETLPAGKIAGQVEFRVNQGSFGNTDVSVHIWKFGGAHIDATYNTYGGYCDSWLAFEPHSANQASSKEDWSNPKCHAGSGGNLAATIIEQVLWGVLKGLFS
ncbi:hypothetical protein [Streptomyces sp. NPDC048637]|uniref:hypothetical protein n=1 Tax=Streptomyces sp. NPDC048637 TaxID=3155636 RepID=UPI00342C5E1D